MGCGAEQVPSECVMSKCEWVNRRRRQRPEVFSVHFHPLSPWRREVVRTVHPGDDEQGTLARQGAAVMPPRFVLLNELALMQIP